MIPLLCQSGIISLPSKSNYTLSYWSHRTNSDELEYRSQNFDIVYLLGGRESRREREEESFYNLLDHLYPQIPQKGGISHTAVATLPVVYRHIPLLVYNITGM